MPKIEHVADKSVGTQMGIGYRPRQRQRHGASHAAQPLPLPADAAEEGLENGAELADGREVAQCWDSSLFDPCVPPCARLRLLLCRCLREGLARGLAVVGLPAQIGGEVLAVPPLPPEALGKFPRTEAPSLL